MAMNIGSGIGSAMSGASVGTAIGGPIGGVIGGGLGLIGGMFGGGNENEMTKQDYKNLQDEAWGYEKEGMALQYGYGEKAAQANHERNLDMWNKTNFEAQRKHMENAGLSVGLMYGNGGGSQPVSTGGANAGVDKPANNPVNTALQKEGLALQMESIKSQNMVNISQANKNNAEAAKIGGADTAEVKSRISMNETTQKLMNSQIELNSGNMTKVIADGQIAMQQYNQELNKTDISNETKETIIKQATQEYENSVVAGLLNIAKTKFTDEQKALVRKQVENYVYEITTGRMSAEAAKKQADNTLKKIMNDYEQNGIHLTNEQESLSRQWMHEGVQIATDLIKMKIGKAKGI